MDKIYNKYGDINLKIKNKNIKVCKYIMISKSKYFNNKLQNNIIEFTIDDIDYNIFIEILDFMHLSIV